jgi:hypothetical protein
LELTPEQIRDGIIERLRDEDENNLYVDAVADPAIFDKSRGDSVADQMGPKDNHRGIVFHRGDNTRLAGKMQLHERLRFDSTGKPMMYIFNTCKDWIRTVPNLPYSLKKPEDVDTDAEDHAFDETKYFLMDRPMTPTKKPPRKNVVYDPYRSD